MTQPRIRLIVGGALFSVGLGGLAGWLLTKGVTHVPLYSVLLVMGLLLILIEIRRKVS